MIRSGWDLIRTGRLTLRRERIRDTAGLLPPAPTEVL